MLQICFDSGSHLLVSEASVTKVWSILGGQKQAPHCKQCCNVTAASISSTYILLFDGISRELTVAICVGMYFCSLRSVAVVVLRNDVRLGM